MASSRSMTAATVPASLKTGTMIEMRGGRGTWVNRGLSPSRYGPDRRLPSPCAIGVAKLNVSKPCASGIHVARRPPTCRRQKGRGRARPAACRAPRRRRSGNPRAHASLTSVHVHSTVLRDRDVVDRVPFRSCSHRRRRRRAWRRETRSRRCRPPRPCGAASSTIVHVSSAVGRSQYATRPSCRSRQAPGRRSRRWCRWRRTPLRRAAPAADARPALFPTLVRRCGRQDHEPAVDRVAERDRRARVPERHRVEEHLRVGVCELQLPTRAAIGRLVDARRLAGSDAERIGDALARSRRCRGSRASRRRERAPLPCRAAVDRSQHRSVGAARPRTRGRRRR